MLCGPSVFFITSNLDPKLMPKEQDQIMMRKVCALIQSFVSCLPNYHSSHSEDREKYHTLLTLIRRVNIVHDVTNVEQHELLGADASRPLLDSRMGEPTRCSRSAKPFLLNRSGNNRACLSCTLCKPSR